MAVIAFSDERVWLKARWAVRILLNDVIAIHSSDEELVKELNEAIALSGLHFDLLAPDVRQRAILALKDTISATLREDKKLGLRWDVELDPESRTMYLQAIKELLNMVESAANPKSSDDN